jgi:hypothetical protein
MPPQEEHEKIENLVDSPHEAEHSARSLEDAADSNATLEGYYAMNNKKPPKEVEEQIDQERNSGAGA